MSGLEKQIEKRKPDITIRGNTTVMSIWIRGRNLKIKISRLGASGFERVDTYSVPLDVLILPIARQASSELSVYCKFAEYLAKEEEPEEEEGEE